MTITNAQKISSIRREIALRKKAYPKWIADGRMHRATAEYEIEVFEEILKDYQHNEKLIAAAEDHQHGKPNLP